MTRVTSGITLFMLSLLALSAHAGQRFIAIAYHDVSHDVAADYDPDQLAVSAGVGLRWISTSRCSRNAATM